MSRRQPDDMLPPESWATGMVPINMWYKRYRDNRHPDTRSIAAGSISECWCGQPSGHDWPGKDGGAPHPRNGTEAPWQRP